MMNVKEFLKNIKIGDNVCVYPDYFVGKVIKFYVIDNKGKIFFFFNKGIDFIAKIIENQNHNVIDDDYAACGMCIKSVDGQSRNFHYGFLCC